MRLTILTGSKNNHKIKVLKRSSGQLAVGISPLDCKYIFYHFRKCYHIDHLYGERGKC